MAPTANAHLPYFINNLFFVPVLGLALAVIALLFCWLYKKAGSVDRKVAEIERKAAEHQLRLKKAKGGKVLKPTGADLERIKAASTTSSTSSTGGAKEVAGAVRT